MTPDSISELVKRLRYHDVDDLSEEFSQTIREAATAAQEHDARIRREALEEAACLSADYDDHQGMRIAAGIRALASAGNPNEAASGSPPEIGHESPAAEMPGAKPQAGSSLSEAPE